MSWNRNKYNSRDCFELLYCIKYIGISTTFLVYKMRVQICVIKLIVIVTNIVTKTI